MQSNETSIGRAAVLLLGLLGGFPPAARGEGAALPRLDRCRVLHVYVPGTKLFQAHGRLWTRQAPKAMHAANRRNLAQRTGWHTPVDIASLSPMPDPPLQWYHFAGIDAVGRRWFLQRDRQKGISARWVEKGTLRTRQFASSAYSSRFGGMCPPAADWLGDGLLSSSRGEIWLTTRDRLWCYRNRQWSSVTLPVPPADQDPRGFFGPGAADGHHHDQLFRDGAAIWLVRTANSNVGKEGSFLLLCTPDTATVVQRTRERFICGIVRHGGTITVLTGGLISASTGPGRIRPTGLFRVVRPRRRPQPKAAVLRRIAELDSDEFPVRKRASAFLRALPMSQRPLLREALARSASPEQRTRLKTAMAAIAAVRVEPGGTLAGYPTGRLLWIARTGRQYVQPWKDNAPQPLLLAGDGGKKLHTIRLPGADVTFDLETADGTIYLRTPQRLYTLDGRTGAVKGVLDFGVFAGTGVRLVAVQDGKLCFEHTVRVDWDKPVIPFWVDPAKGADSPALGGRVIATGVTNVANGSGYCRVANGSGRRLWFLKYSAKPLKRDPKKFPSPQHRISTDLWQAVDGTVQRMGGPCATSYNPSVWPLNDDTAIVVAMSGNDGINGHLFIDRGKTHKHGRMKDLIEQHADRILAMMPDGTMYRAGPHHERVWLIRVKDGLCMAESFYERRGNGAGQVQACGIFRKGRWHRYITHGQWIRGKSKPFFDRPVGIDCASGRMLAYANECTELRWIPVASDAKDDELVLTRPVAFAWTWANRTALPRLTGSWILTPQAADRWIKAYRARRPAAIKAGLLDFEIEYESDELSAVRFWQYNQWRQVDASPYGGSLWEDDAGSVWHLRLREAAVQLPNGTRQTFPLDALHPYYARLAVESPEAVWIATAQSLWRMTLQRNALGQAKKWSVDRRFSQQQHGFGIAGPWLCGDHLYYVSGASLHHVRLSELLGKRKE